MVSQKIMLWIENGTKFIKYCIFMQSSRVIDVRINRVYVSSCVPGICDGRTNALLARCHLPAPVIITRTVYRTDHCSISALRRTTHIIVYVIFSHVCMYAIGST